LLFLAACAGEPKKAPEPEIIPQSLEPVEIFQIQDHAAKSAGGEIPPWVNVYLYEGIGAIENQAEYQNKYIFIAENTGTNFTALRQWMEGFMVLQDFPRLVSSRIQTRFTASTPGYPDDNYGPFFEGTIKKSSDTFYNGAVTEGTFWLLVQYFKEDGITPDREMYLFFILISIDKTLLEIQINEILNNIPADTATRDQSILINNLKENFYTGF
jgi:hypothetical protein